MKMKTTPRFILSRKIAVQQYKTMKSMADSVSYSFKTNKNVGIVLRDSTKSFFSVHSEKSVDMLDCPERIWFFAQAWNRDEITSLIQDKGIKNFVVDNRNDLDELIKFFDNRNEHEKINILLRMRLKEHTIHTGKHYVFGMYSTQIIELIPFLRKKKYISKLGVHFHRKTQNISEWSLKYELENTLPIKILEHIDIVNIGGGIPSKYKNFSADVQKNIFDRIKELRTWLKKYNINMIIEPGRFIAAPSVRLEAEILNIYNNNIIINCSIYNGVMDTFISYIRLVVEGELSKGDAYTIKGKTPDSMDIFRYRVFLKKPKKGDKIVFLNAGAYTFSTDFCGLDPIKTVIVD